MLGSMAKLDELVIELTAETSKLRSQLKKASNITDKATDTMKKSVGDMAKNSGQSVSKMDMAFASFAGNLAANLATGALTMFKNAVGELFTQFKEGIDDAANQEKAFIRLANSMQLAGTYSRESQKDLQNFSFEMEALTGIGDDVIASNLAVLSSLTQLESEGLKRAQKAAADLASGIGMDLTAATTLVGKALAGQTSALTRYGITVEKGANETETFTNVMGALESKFAGAAQGAMKTFDGSLLGLLNQFNNFVEAIANGIVQNEVFISAMSEGTKIFGELAKGASDSGMTLREGFANALLGTVKVLGIATTAVDLFVRNLQVGFRTLLAPVFAISDGIDYLRGKLSGEDVEFGKKSAENLKQMSKTLNEDTALSTMAESLARIQVAGESAMGSLKNSAEVAAPTVNGTTGEVKELNKEMQRSPGIADQFAQSIVKQTQSIDNQYKMQAEALKLKREQDLVTTEEYFAQLNELQADQNSVEQEALAEALANKTITEQEFEAARNQLKAQANMENQKLEKARTDAIQKENEARQANLKSSLGVIASLQNSNIKELHTIGKAAAVANATIDGYAAVQKALASAPPPFNFAVAALVGAATAANVSKIAGVGLKRGIDSVPGVGTADNFPAVLAPGERVVPSQTNQDLTEFLKRQDMGAKTVNINISNNVPASREAGNLMIEAINDAIASGSLRILNS